MSLFSVNGMASPASNYAQVYAKFMLNSFASTCLHLLRVANSHSSLSSLQWSIDWMVSGAEAGEDGSTWCTPHATQFCCKLLKFVSCRHLIRNSKMRQFSCTMFSSCTTSNFGVNAIRVNATCCNSVWGISGTSLSYIVSMCIFVCSILT